MVKDLYVTVPSFFRCPISLDVMKSPVSLCTGVTYDRDSIERWLDSGNNTCPATMQPLQTKDVVPNRTLQRLIKIWSESVHHNCRVDSVSNLAPSPEEIEAIVKALKSGDREQNVRRNNLSKLLTFARESEESREVLALTEGVVSMLVDLMIESTEIEEVVRLLDVMLPKIGERKELMTLQLKKGDEDSKNFLCSLLSVLQQGRLDSRIGSLRILEAIAIDAESQFMILENEGLLTEMVRFLCLESDPVLIEASLSCLIAISKPKRVKVKLAHLKTVSELRKLLKSPDVNVSITEKAMKLLETMSSSREGREDMCSDAACLEAVMEKMLKVTAETTERAVTVMWSVCYLFRDRRAQEAVASRNGLTIVLLLMQSNCSPAVRLMAADLLKIFRVNSKSRLSSYDTKTTHIMPF
ncbi:hypothetical protein K2173_000871 [Erythroxylum novogranatense]|uniref:U-box domain-containing protein n=1 Tax=Erythroxylum novogranatense TaxID=1862640 RepID=A0AAV8TRL1_9ROSI|nr:hypothetical protein K2173_000871 [Erythroxylum novogranatense]